MKLCKEQNKSNQNVHLDKTLRKIKEFWNISGVPNTTSRSEEWVNLYVTDCKCVGNEPRNSAVEI